MERREADGLGKALFPRSGDDRAHATVEDMDLQVRVPICGHEPSCEFRHSRLSVEYR
jgi:hypothetical protein